MWLREDLLKSIWHAFTALDVDQRGKVSKSQLKVLSHSLCTVMKIPHDPLTLEEHFRDDDKGPLSNQGYMPYLNRFILDKVREDFDVLEFNKMCWTLCHKKNVCTDNLLISNYDAFKIWCIFNFLSEDKYPLVIVTEELEYFLQKLTEAMASGWSEEKLSNSELKLHKRRCLTVWEMIQMVGTGVFSKGMDQQSLSMGINEVFQELILDVLKQGYLMKKGHKRKNWTERWFVLRTTSMSYYVCEDLVDMKGHITLDKNCSVESLPDRESKKCLFIIKCPDKSFEISASDKKKKVEWIQAVQSCIQLLRLGLPSPHREARLRRRELRQRRREKEDDLTERMKQLQAANDSNQMQLDAMRKKMEAVAAEAATEEERMKKTQLDLQDRFRLDLEREKMVRLQMEEQVAQKSNELEQNLLRIRQMEDMYRQLEAALEDERKAKQDEEAARNLQARLLEEETARRAELEHLHFQQMQDRKGEPAAEHPAQEQELRAAVARLEKAETERHGALRKYEEVSRNLERAANKTKKWKDQVAKHEGLVRLIQPGHKSPHRVSNWGAASVSEVELELRKKLWQESKNPPTPSSP
ncbi:switch-associated protein 70 [Corythoichthys intestinalis]|uniref:switch-associated protein 70 n=1 Tax=Corythoichthys intestinalis TaxID=161448 RepID=UPI0025A4FB6D|nr:switch-associated protein 70 [Corythoichthys intestinalis]XP_061796147.1 switch-associated protein 70-like [Nerophis lumbriciformis]